MRPRDVLNPLAVGAATGLLGLSTAVGALTAYEWNQDRHAEAARMDLQEATQNEVDTYFSGMNHLEVDSEIGRYGTLMDLSVELVPEVLDGPSPEIAERLQSASVMVTGVVDTEDGPAQVMGSGFFIEDGEGNVRLLTAGHVTYDMYPDSISVYSGNSDRFHRVDVTQFDSHLVDSERSDKEDIATGTLADPERYRGLALPVRDLEANPLRTGEQLHLTNFQRGREIGEEITYSMVYVEEKVDSDGRFILAMGDLMQGRTEDELRPGGSGGVVTDDFGEVVGISVESSAGSEEPAYVCGDDLRVSVPGETFGREGLMTIDLRVPFTNDECDPGMSMGVIRTVGSLATSDQIG